MEDLPNELLSEIVCCSVKEWSNAEPSDEDLEGDDSWSWEYRREPAKTLDRYRRVNRMFSTLSCDQVC